MHLGMIHQKYLIDHKTIDVLQISTLIKYVTIFEQLKKLPGLGQRIQSRR
jgi:hypothetical protein